MLKAVIVTFVFYFLVAPASAQQSTEVRGILVATNKATLSSELSARVLALPKKMGESFKQGEVLIQLDCRLFKAQLDKTLAEENIAQQRLENTNQLNLLNSIGTLEVAIAKAELQKVQAERSMAQLNVERCEITAPFDGAVEQLDINPFEVVQQQQPLLKIVGITSLQADIIVPAEWLIWLKPGMPVSLLAEETQQAFSAQVSHISPGIDPGSQTLQIRAVIKDVPVNVLPGMSVVAKFVIAEDNKELP